MNNTAHPAERIRLGRGPSPVSQRVLRAMSAPTLGHLDPRYRAILDETCEMLRQVFQTKNPLTLPVSSIGDVAVLSACKRMQRMPFAASPRASGGR